MIEKQEEFISTQLQRFEFTKTDLQELADSFSELKIEGVEDRENYNKVHEARMTLVRKRTQIGKVVKELKDMANSFKAAAVERGDEFIAIIQPTENSLWDKETAIDREKERIRVEKQRLEDERIQTMIDQLAAVGQVADFVTIKGYTQEQFDEVLIEATNLHNAKIVKEAQEREEARIREEEETRIRIQKEAEERELRLQEEERNANERARLQKIQEDQERREKELREREERVKAEAKAIQDAHEKREREELQRQQVAAQMREAAERAEREKAAEEERLRLQKIEDDRIAEEAQIEALNSATDPEKFAVMHQILTDCKNSTAWPKFESLKGRKSAGEVWGHLRDAIEICRIKMTKETE